MGDVGSAIAQAIGTHTNTMLAKDSDLQAKLKMKIDQALLPNQIAQGSADIEATKAGTASTLQQTGAREQAQPYALDAMKINKFEALRKQGIPVVDAANQAFGDPAEAQRFIDAWTKTVTAGQDPASQLRGGAPVAQPAQPAAGNAPAPQINAQQVAPAQPAPIPTEQRGGGTIPVPTSAPNVGSVPTRIPVSASPIGTAQVPVQQPAATPSTIVPSAAADDVANRMMQLPIDQQIDIAGVITQRNQQESLARDREERERMARERQATLDAYRSAVLEERDKNHSAVIKMREENGKRADRKEAFAERIGALNIKIREGMLGVAQTNARTAQLRLNLAATSHNDTQFRADRAFAKQGLIQSQSALTKAQGALNSTRDLLANKTPEVLDGKVTVTGEDGTPLTMSYREVLQADERRYTQEIDARNKEIYGYTDNGKWTPGWHDLSAAYGAQVGPRPKGQGSAKPLMPTHPESISPVNPTTLRPIGGSGKPFKVTSRAQYDALPNGTAYVDSKGNYGIKGQR